MWKSWGWPGLSHAAGALAIQIYVAAQLAWWFNTNIFVQAYWWYGAVIATLIFALREVWQMRRAKPPVWWQNRTPWDVGTAAVPVVLVALGVGLI